MNYSDLIKQLTTLGASSPSYEATELARVVCGVSREWCILNKDADLPFSFKLADALSRRRSGVPLQYILGEAWFYGNRFIVSDSCLIPQPDTEHLVDLSLKHLKPGSVFADLCTGSGCIAISLLIERNDITAVAADISAPALAVAEQNAALHKVSERISFVRCDVMTGDVLPLITEADVIVSNPPYINTDVIPTLSKEVLHEPALALDGGDDGLVFYRRLINQLSPHIRPDSVMLLEIGYDQQEQIADLCRKVGLFYNFHRDFGGNVRVCEIHRVK